MKAASVKSFSKKLACPSSNLLLSFYYQSLAPEINFLVKHHLAVCDFCYCEIPLLAFYTQPQKGEGRAPELPINLRVLAESILGQDRSAKVVDEARVVDEGRVIDEASEKQPASPNGLTFVDG